MARRNSAILAALITFFGSAAFAQTDLENALADGGERLNADQIAEILIGHTVTAKSGDKTFRFYYAPNNIVSGELTNGGWQGAGAFAITDTDQVCVSMAADKGRFRCLTVLRVGGRVQKFNTAGKKMFDILGFEPSTGL
ncbi:MULTISPECIES: hypothetical protein [unclassified Ruegeria]|uniref:hypothetical protein n=1 Tax=unclassified Ruegeria TaxID=2625375 RepID=UPI001487B169|nr:MULTISPECIES: hypothetical protein [unclassified Ruegeria]